MVFLKRKISKEELKRYFLFFFLPVLMMLFSTLAISTLPSNLYASYAHLVSSSGETNVMAEIYCDYSDDNSFWGKTYQFSYEDVLEYAFDTRLTGMDIGKSCYRQFYIDDTSEESTGYSFSSTFVFPGTLKQRNVRAISASMSRFLKDEETVPYYFHCPVAYSLPEGESLQFEDCVIISYEMAQDYMTFNGLSGDNPSAILGSKINFYQWKKRVSDSSESWSSPYPLTIIGILDKKENIANSSIDISEGDFCFLSSLTELHYSSTVIEELSGTSGMQELDIRAFINKFQIGKVRTNYKARIRFYYVENGSRVYLGSNDVSNLQKAADENVLLKISIFWWLLFVAAFSCGIFCYIKTYKVHRNIQTGNSFFCHKISGVVGVILTIVIMYLLVFLLCLGGIRICSFAVGASLYPFGIAASSVDLLFLLFLAIFGCIYEIKNIKTH